MKKVLFLIGMPSAGKTKWGKDVAQHFNLPFVDLDEYIAIQEGKTIREIFKEQGEPAFREMENNALRKIVGVNQAPFILSCGGGTIMEVSNLTFMKENGVVVFLNAKMETLLANLKKDERYQRPLLNADNGDSLEQLEQLFAKRKEAYHQADHIFDVETLSVNDFETIITTCIKQH